MLINRKTKKRGILAIVFLIFVCSLISYKPHNFQHLKDTNDEKILTSQSLEYIVNLIYIDDSISAYRWSKIVTENDWCSGTGTDYDPYIIKNVVVDGNYSNRCIEIRNSNVYFIIENCKFFNSGPDWSGDGIYLENVQNGQIISNNCSNNTASGIHLKNCDDLEVSNNILNQNIDGIYIDDSRNIEVSKNNLFLNFQKGISLYYADNNQIVENTLDNNNNGIYLLDSNNTALINNILINNYGTGIVLRSGANNLFYGNRFSDNVNGNADDDGENNTWDYNNAGNYWDDYNGRDANDNGIGDSPYEIPGRADSIDRYPIFSDELDLFSESNILIFSLISVIFSSVALLSFTIIKIYKSTSKYKQILNEKVNRVKETLLEMEIKYTRIKLSDIIEELGIEDEVLIIKILKAMINNNEIFAYYFESTKSIAFIQNFGVKDKFTKPFEEKRKGKQANIKKTILEMGTQFDRIEISEIAEVSSVQDKIFIEKIVKKMVKEEEIYAEYFESTQSILFDQQANIDEIDKLLRTYKDWEEKEFGKKI